MFHRLFAFTAIVVVILPSLCIAQQNRRIPLTESSSEYKIEFSVEVEANGTIQIDERVVPPLSGTLLNYRLDIEPDSGCTDTIHATRLLIQRQDDPEDKFELELEIPECEVIEGPIGYRVKRRKTYDLSLKCEGFRPGDTIKGEAVLEYQIGITKTTPLGWERQTAAEAALIREMQANLQGRKTERDKEPDEERCGGIGPKQKHGLRQHRYTEITPDYGSLEIWVDWLGGRAYGVMDVEVYGYANQKEYNKCTGQLYSYTAAIEGIITLRLDIDVSSGSADVEISASFRETEYWGAPQWSGSRGIINSLIKSHGTRLINGKLDGYERIIEDRINSSRGATPVIRAPHALHFISPEALRENPNAYTVLKREWTLFGARKPYNLIVVNELNPEYIAARLNNQSFNTTIPHIDVDTDFGLWIKDMDLKIKTEDSTGTGSIQLGDVRVIVAPFIRIELDDATVYFKFTSRTNIFGGGVRPLEGSGKVALSLAHMYEQPKIEFNDFEILELTSPQLNDGLTRLIRQRLNAELPEKIGEDDALLTAIATLLNDAISDAIGRTRFPQFLSRDAFLDQLNSN